MKRALLFALMALAGILCLPRIRASATPIRPDIQKVVSESQTPAAEFPPARAGWNGPEAASNTQNPNPTLEKIGPQASARAVRQSLFSMAIPDPRFLALIVLVILLLRRIRKHTSRQPAAVSAASFNSPVVMSAPVGEDDLVRSDDAEKSRPAA